MSTNQTRTFAVETYHKGERIKVTAATWPAAIKEANIIKKQGGKDAAQGNRQTTGS
jgi:hypothetical protein